MTKNPDLLLVNAFSWTLEKRPCYLPYGILYLASFIRTKGIKVTLYDRNTDYSHNIAEFLEYFNKIKPKVVGISVLTGPVISDALMISKAIKNISPQTKIIWGGLYPTIFPRDVLQENCVDFIIQAEGELALYDLTSALLKNKQYHHIKNIGFRSKGKIVINPIRSKLMNLNDNVMPAWDLINMENYLAKRFFASRVLTMNTSKGCQFKCTFCFNQGLPFQQWRGLSAKNILKQINFLNKKYCINGIQFYEDSFDTDKKRVKEFCDLMIKSGLYKKVSWSHFSNIVYFDKTLVSYEKKAGLRYIEYGVESGSPRILKWVKKPQTIPQIKQVYNQCQKIGIKTAVLFMIGFPDETLKELNMTVKLVEELPAHILICTIYRPYPHTPLFDYCVWHKKFLPPKTLEKQAEFYRFSHMNKDEINLSKVPTQILLNLQKKFYAKFALSELILCLKNFNFDLIFYYLKQQLHPRVFLFTINSLLIRFLSKKKVK